MTPAPITPAAVLQAHQLARAAQVGPVNPGLLHLARLVLATARGTPARQSQTKGAA